MATVSRAPSGRLQAHYSGKQYRGWFTIRERLKELKALRGGAGPARASSGGQRDERRDRDRRDERYRSDRCVACATQLGCRSASAVAQSDVRPVIAAETEAETGTESEAMETATGIEVGAGIGKEIGPGDDEAEAPTAPGLQGDRAAAAHEVS